MALVNPELALGMGWLGIQEVESEPSWGKDYLLDCAHCGASWAFWKALRFQKADLSTWTSRNQFCIQQEVGPGSEQQRVIFVSFQKEVDLAVSG